MTISTDLGRLDIDPDEQLPKTKAGWEKLCKLAEKAAKEYAEDNNTPWAVERDPWVMIELRPCETRRVACWYPEKKSKLRLTRRVVLEVAVDVEDQGGWSSVEAYVRVSWIRAALRARR